MKLLIIFDKDIQISPEKICVHVGHCTRSITSSIFYNEDFATYSEWRANEFKTVLLRDKITNIVIKKIKEVGVHSYKIYDAGLDGVFTPGTILGYAVLVPNSDDTFKRLRTLKF